MVLDILIGLGVVAGLGVFLAYSLVFPERF
ncbi:MAG TPA: potassium-transporting ATPase subunit F [Candidatus Ozemobacteraceae bacterium]|nr:potassium-transporting ATPase subunit F [Candidatus Ozemobacteraceae bacterium]